MSLIDTMELKTDLLNRSMPEAQASAIVATWSNANTRQLATKPDLAEVCTEIEALRGDFKALNDKVNLLLAFNTPLLFAVLALLWKTFFAAS